MDVRKRFWIETVLAAASAVFFLLSVLWKEWIELTFGVDPDHGSGAAEWGIAIGALVLTIAFAVAARIEHRHYRTATESR